MAARQANSHDDNHKGVMKILDQLKAGEAGGIAAKRNRISKHTAPMYIRTFIYLLVNKFYI